MIGVLTVIKLSLLIVKAVAGRHGLLAESPEATLFSEGFDSFVFMAIDRPEAA